MSLTMERQIRFQDRRGGHPVFKTGTYVLNQHKMRFQGIKSLSFVTIDTRTTLNYPSKQLKLCSILSLRRFLFECAICFFFIS